jgi:hypothetical protein
MTRVKFAGTGNRTDGMRPHNTIREFIARWAEVSALAASIWFAAVPNAMAQSVGLTEIEGTVIQGQVTDELVGRNRGLQGTAVVRSVLRLTIGPPGAIEQTWTVGRQRPLSESFTLDQIKSVKSGGGGEAVWTFDDAMLTFVRTYRAGALKVEISFARGTNGLTCRLYANFARERGVGPISFDSDTDGTAIEVFGAKQLSSTCQVTRPSRTAVR